MIRPFAWAVATVLLAFGSPGVYAGDSDSDVQGSSPGDAAAVVPLQLPQFVPSGDDFYPESAARKLAQGAAGFEIQIDAEGHAQIVSETFADNPDFGTSAAEFLKRGRFRIPEDWLQSGGPGAHFVLEVQFSLARGSATCTPKPPRVADTEVLTVCRTIVSRRGGRL
jgi:hypothetical protein